MIKTMSVHTTIWVVCSKCFIEILFFAFYVLKRGEGAGTIALHPAHASGILIIMVIQPQKLSVEVVRDDRVSCCTT